MKFFTAFYLIFHAAVVFAQDTPALGDRYALIVGGVGGEKEFTEKYYQQTHQLYRLLLDSLKYDAKKVSYLFGDADYDSLKLAKRATANEIRKSFDRFARDMKSPDQLLVVLIGHGTYDGEWSKFNIIGPDLRDVDYAQMLAKLPTKKVVFVNTSSASGPFIRTLSGEQRVIITATKSGTQAFETNFADFFLEALATPSADFDKDKRVSVLEAFKYARASQDKWFDDNGRLRAEHPLLDDNGDGDGSQEPTNADDGLLASTIYFAAPEAELVSASRRIESGGGTETDRRMLERDRIEREIESLKARKSQLDPAEYDKQLETLLIRLARTNQQIKKAAEKSR